MLRKFIACLTALVFLQVSSATAIAGGQPEPARVAKLQAQVMAIPAGAVVEVKLLDGQKLTGKLGTVTQDAFEVQSLTQGKVESKPVSFAAVKSIHQKGKPMGRGLKIVLWSLAVFGVFVAIFTAVCAGTGACDS